MYSIKKLRNQSKNERNPLSRNEQVERSSRLGGSISAEFNRIRTFLF